MSTFSRIAQWIQNGQVQRYMVGVVFGAAADLPGGRRATTTRASATRRSRAASSSGPSPATASARTPVQLGLRRRRQARSGRDRAGRDQAARRRRQPRDPVRRTTRCSARDVKRGKPKEHLARHPRVKLPVVAPTSAAAHGRCAMSTAGAYVLPVILALPLLGALFVMLTPRGEGAIARGVGLAVSTVTFLMSLLVLATSTASRRATSSSPTRSGCQEPRHPLQARHRRHLAVAGAADHVPHAGHAAGGHQLDRQARARVHRRVPGPRDRHARRLHLPRPVRVLRVLGGDAHPDVPDDRHLGRAAAALRVDQVRALHDGRLAAHAGGDLLPVRPARPGHRGLHHRPRRGERRAASRGWPHAAGAGRATRRSGASPPSPWPSRSRSRCSRSTPGCPTPTSRRRPRAR
jgi:hypothetical protein